MIECMNDRAEEASWHSGKIIVFDDRETCLYLEFTTCWLDNVEQLNLPELLFPHLSHEEIILCVCVGGGFHRIKFVNAPFQCTHRMHRASIHYMLAFHSA